MPRLSLCLIARDEERFLPGCLESVKGVVDEIVLVDTGSKDRTKEIAAAAGARVFDLPWSDDFSAPRNEAIRHARGDWLLQLDADERLAPGAGSELLRTVRHGEFDVGLLPLHNASDVDSAPGDVLSGRTRIDDLTYRPRLIHSSGAPRYAGVVHESVDAWFYAARRRAQHVEAPIIHLGYVASLVTERRKHERNLALLRRRCEQVPGDLPALGYLSWELLVAGDRVGAWEAVESGWARFEEQPSPRFVHRLAVMRAWLAVERGDPEVALATLKLAVEQRGEQVDFAYWAGRAWESIAQRETDPAARQRAASMAAGMYERAVVVHPLPATEKLTGLGVADLHVSRGHALIVAERISEAASAFESALRTVPSSVGGRLGLSEISLRQGRVTDALDMLESVLVGGCPSPDPWLLAAEAALGMGAREKARAFVTRAAQLHRTSAFVARHRRSRLDALVAALT